MMMGKEAALMPGLATGFQRGGAELTRIVDRQGRGRGSGEGHDPDGESRLPQ